MKRRNFFKKFGLGIGALLIAPKILVQQEETQLPKTVFFECGFNRTITIPEGLPIGTQINILYRTSEPITIKFKGKEQVNYYPTKKESYDGIPIKKHFIHDEVGHWDSRKFTPKL